MKGTGLFFVLSVFIVKAHAQNYDESKVPAYTLPDALKTLANVVVTDKTKWETVRRPEIVTLFENNIYGQMPKVYDSIKFSVTNENALAMNGRAHLKEVSIVVFKNNKSVKINLVLFVPNKIKCPAPVFLLINNRSKDNTDPTRVIKSDFWPAETVIDSSYAIAAFQVNDAAPDSLKTFKNGVLQLYPEQLISNNGMRAIGAWAWAASRVMDYFEKDSDIDAKKVAVVGHSRGGKAALWAAAQDQRFAIPFSNCSGNTGAALARRRFGETISIINRNFPYWFNDNYKKFNDNEDSLPVDQHMLMALMAPRPVYATSASKDLWADPKGSFLSLKNAEKVYALYGMTSTLPADPPLVNTPVINSPLGYHNREGDHNLTAYDWGNFIKFANYHHLKNITPNCYESVATDKTDTLFPLADAFVRNGSYAGKNYGNDTFLIVKGSNTTGYTRSSYLKFSLNNLSNVTSAKLRIYGSNVDNTLGINLSAYGITADSWTENGICFSTAPAASTSALSSVSVNNVKKYYEFNVTSFVQTQVAGDKVASFLIRNPANQDKIVSFKSKESTQNRPQLIITTTSAITTNSARSNASKNIFSSQVGLEKPRLFPNPLRNRFSINFPEKYDGDFATLQIADVAGKIYEIGEHKVKPGGCKIEADISKLSLISGVYFLKIFNTRRNDVIKFIVQ